MAALREIVFDCKRAAPLARFWAAVLDGYAVRPYDAADIEQLAGLGLTPETDPTVLVDGPGPILCFQEVPEPKTAKNRVHLDALVPDLPAEVERLVALGASVHEEFDGHATMLDPEGNEFCIQQRRK